MRLSTNTIYQTGINRIIEAQSEQSKLQEKISTGKQIVTASDDPVGATKALKISQAQQVNTQLTANRNTVTDKFNNYESNLSSVSEQLLQVKTMMVQAGNGLLTAADKKNIAIQISSAKESLMALANAKDSDSNFIYSGFSSTTQTYDTNNVYQGSSSLLNLQVDNNRTMQIGLSGSSVFEANGKNLFTTLSNLITNLNTTTDSATFTSNLATASAELQTLQDNVINVRAQNGANINQLDVLNNAAASIGLQLTKELSAIQDLDYAQAISDLSKNQTILQAAQKSFVTTTSLTLFNYLN